MSATANAPAAARAYAVFLSDLPVGAEVTPEQIAAATRHAMHAYGGTRGCAGEVAARYCDRPEIGMPRMRWALRVVETARASGPRSSRCWQPHRSHE